MSNSLRDKKIVIIGCCGTVGRELISQLIKNYNVGNLTCIDNNESEIFFLSHEYANKQCCFFLGDIRDERSLNNLFQGGEQIVFHAAAFKHVSLCEHSPIEAVKTNILGVQNVISAANLNGVEKVIFTSSDKAVNPTSVMGTSKLMGERLITAANNNQFNSGTIFASTRFGNVLGSKGSVIPIFREQIKQGGPVTLTHLGMTRFIMSIKQAVQLVIDSSFLCRGGEVFVTKMPVIRIKDLAEVMIKELAPQFGYEPEEISIKIIGSKPGEKKYEELMTIEELRRIKELTRYFVVPPAFTSLYHEIDYSYKEEITKGIAAPYNSQNEVPMTHEELRQFLLSNDLLLEQDQKFKPSSRFWGDEKSI